MLPMCTDTLRAAITARLHQHRPPYAGFITGLLFPTGEEESVLVIVPIRLGLDAARTPHDLDVAWYIPVGPSLNASSIDREVTSTTITHWPFDCDRALVNPFTIVVAPQTFAGQRETRSTHPPNVCINNLVPGLRIKWSGNVLVFLSDHTGVRNLTEHDVALATTIVRRVVREGLVGRPQAPASFDHPNICRAVAFYSPWSEFIILAHVSRQYRQAALVTFQGRIAERLGGYLLPDTSTVYEKKTAASLFLDVIAATDSAVVGSLVLALLTLSAATDDDYPLSNINILAPWWSQQEWQELLENHFHFTQPDRARVSVMPDRPFMGHAAQHWTFVNDSNHHYMDDLTQHPCDTVCVQANVANEYVVAREGDKLLSEAHHGAHEFFGVVGSRLVGHYVGVPVVYSGLNWLDLLRYGQAGRYAHAAVQDIVARRVSEIVAEFVPVLHRDELWSLLSKGGGGITGSVVEWVTQADPLWWPSDLNMVVSRGGATALREFLKSWGCQESFLSVYLPAGRSTYANSRPLRCDEYPDWADVSWKFQTPDGEFITLTEARESTVVHHLLQCRHSLQAVLLTRNLLIVFYPRHQVSKEAVLRAGGLAGHHARGIKEVRYRLNAMGCDTRRYGSEVRPCGEHCVGLLRRLRGGKGVGIYQWSQATELDDEEKAAYEGFWLSKHAVAWTWAQCHNFACATYGFPRDLQVKGPRPTIVSHNPKEVAVLLKVHAVKSCRPAFSAVYDGVLYATSCTSPFVVPVPLDHGIQTYRGPDDLRAYTWIQPTVLASQRVPRTMSPTEVYGPLISLSQLRWSLPMADDARLLVFLTTTTTDAPVTQSLTPASFEPRPVHGDVLLMLEVDGEVVDLLPGMVSQCQRCFQSWWAEWALRVTDAPMILVCSGVLDPEELWRLLSAGWIEVAEACSTDRDTPLAQQSHLMVRLLGEVIENPEETVTSTLRLGFPDWTTYHWPSAVLLPVYMEQMRVVHFMQRQAYRAAQEFESLAVQGPPVPLMEFDLVLLPDTQCIIPGRSGLWSEDDWEHAKTPFSRGQTVLVDAQISIDPSKHDVLLAAQEIQRVYPEILLH
ncbi:hypothetical protein B0H15DRAFT_943755 [Mycena belliarum]|uniref:Uncharacterized protein n=1 Tax=Mycena belliarum TaxID=1033014 RepID=A0AAD6UG86_9AGAR|nr:hypothetical protein B0H15DRAFT_943755 [Mycena belliae]